MSNELMRWVDNQEQSKPVAIDKLDRVQGVSELVVPDFWKTPTANKILTLKFPVDMRPGLALDPSNSTILGGMCLLTTIDMKRMSRKETTFNNTADFETWFKSWYPRIDQIHDAVGIPPNFSKKVIYVSEDSFFAHRIASYTGLPKEEVQTVLHDVHEQQGQPTLKRYLKNQGYKGEVEVVYTSEIEKELETSLRIWERMNGTKFRGGDRNFAKVELMYTGMWLDILNLQDSAIIFEAANKMTLKGWLKLEEWNKTQQYGIGLNKNLGIAGYLPFITTKGDSGELSFSDVPNIGNYETHKIPDEDMPWYIANFLYMKKAVVNGGPSAILQDDANRMIHQDLKQYYQDEITIK